MAKVRDYQKSKVYDWDLGFVQHDEALNVNMSLEEIAELVEFIANDFHLEDAIQVTEGVGMDFPMAYRNVLNKTTYLHFPEHARKRGVVLHEMTHAIIYELYGHNTLPAHGGKFVGYYIMLIETYSEANIGDIIAMAHQVGVKYHTDIWATPDEIAGYVH